METEEQEQGSYAGALTCVSDTCPRCGAKIFAYGIGEDAARVQLLANWNGHMWEYHTAVDGIQ